MLVKKIENHFHRAALHADLQQNNVYNPFSKNSKAMIRELGNVEFFELCETIPKVQCSHCFLYWNQGIVHCTCGQFLIDSESRRKFNKLRLDPLSIPNYLIKKGRSHDARHGKTEEQKEYHMAWNAWKRCCKKVDSQRWTFCDRFLRDPVYRESQLAIGWTEQKCKEWDELAKEDHTYRLTPEEQRRYQGQWYLTLNKSGKKWAYETSIRFFELLSLWKNVYTTSQANKLKSLFLQNNTVFGIPLQAHRGGKRIGNELIRIFKLMRILFAAVGFVYSRWRIHCNRWGVQTDTPDTSFFSCTLHMCAYSLHGSRRAKAQCVCCAHSFHPHAIHDVCSSVVGPRSVLLLFLSVLYLFSSTLYLFSARHSIFNVDNA